jgi:hypothetical protein
MILHPRSQRRTFDHSATVVQALKPVAETLQFVVEYKSKPGGRYRTVELFLELPELSIHIAVKANDFGESALNSFLEPDGGNLGIRCRG